MERTSDADAVQLEIRESQPPYGLTARELDVLTLVAGGLSNPEIAAHLRSSVRTITTHVQRILAKLDQPSRAGAAAVSVEEGIQRLPVTGGGRCVEMLPIGVVDQLAAGSDGPLARGVARGRVRARPRPYLIGAALPLTGPASEDGEERRNGSGLAIAQLNERGGIAGRPVRQVLVDTDITTPEGVRAGLRRLVEHEVDAITTGYALTADPSRYTEVAEYGCPLLNTMTLESEAQLVREHDDRVGHVFQVGPTEMPYGLGAMRFFEHIAATGQWQPPNRRILMIQAPMPAAHLIDDITFTLAERGDWEVDGPMTVDLIGADWRPVVRRLRATEPAVAVFMHPIASEIAAFQRAFTEEPVDSLIYAIYGPSTPNYLDEAGASAEGVLWSTVTGLYHDRLGAWFAQRYLDAFGRPPGRSQAGLSFDQVHLLANVWAQVGNPRRFGAVAAQLRQTIHRGVNGTYFLGHDRQCGLAYPDETPDPSQGQAHLIHQVQDGEHRILDPAPYADAGFRTPSWFSSAVQSREREASGARPQRGR